MSSRWDDPAKVQQLLYDMDQLTADQRHGGCELSDTQRVAVLLVAVRLGESMADNLDLSGYLP